MREPPYSKGSGDAAQYESLGFSPQTRWFKIKRTVLGHRTMGKWYLPGEARAGEVWLRIVCLSTCLKWFKMNTTGSHIGWSRRVWKTHLVSEELRRIKALVLTDFLALWLSVVCFVFVFWDTKFLNCSRRLTLPVGHPSPRILDYKCGSLCLGGSQFMNFMNHSVKYDCENKPCLSDCC